MSDRVNARRSLRAERAALTRRRIAEAGRRLFVRDGYGATTLQAVADEAGVAVQTVYAVYGSKAGILRELLGSVIFQRTADGIAQEAMSAAASGDVGRAIDAFARSIRARWDAGSDVVLAYREAASTDTDLRAEREAILKRRSDGLVALANALAPGLRPGVGRDLAIATLDVLTLPDVYVQLVVERSWSSDDYESWLARILRDQLIG